MIIPSIMSIFWAKSIPFWISSSVFTIFPIAVAAASAKVAEPEVMVTASEEPKLSDGPTFPDDVQIE